mgnify:CR=1 FL=1
MIKVAVLGANNQVEHLEASGHALSDKYGKDLVCAGVSAIMFGLINMLDEKMKSEVKIEVTEIIAISVIKNSEELQTMLRTGIFQLKYLAEKYPQNITINVKGVKL